MIYCSSEHESLDFEPTCSKCDDKEREMDKMVDHMADRMKGVIEILYGRDRIDVAILEDHLDEICYQLGLKLPAELPRIERKRSEIFYLASELSSGFAAQHIL